MKSTVKLRVKKLSDGNGSYYLDWFQGGKRHYEYLKLYTVLSDRPTKASLLDVASNTVYIIF
jgi:hypothetical protein